MTTPKYDPASRAADAKVAEMMGFTVVYGAPSKLLLDLDGGLAAYVRVRDVLLEDVYDDEERWPSKTVGHWHVVVTLTQDFTALERIAMQAALGSDGVREAIALLRLRGGIEEPSMLFRPGPKLLPAFASPRRDFIGTKGPGVDAYADGFEGALELLRRRIDMLNDDGLTAYAYAVRAAVRDLESRGLGRSAP